MAMKYFFDVRVSERIQAWGKPQYMMWYVFAVHLMYVYIASWLIFSALGWLVWWTVPVAAFSAWILTLGTQAIVARERPKFESTTGYKMWWKTYSLPSGHATISAAVATVLLLTTHFPNPIWLVTLAVVYLIVEVLVAIGRIVVGVHYLADVIVGFVLGIVFGVMYSML